MKVSVWVKFYTCKQSLIFLSENMFKINENNINNLCKLRLVRRVIWCKHNKWKSRCIKCGGNYFFEHKQSKAKSGRCSGNNSICKHNWRRSKRKDRKDCKEVRFVNIIDKDRSPKIVLPFCGTKCQYIIFTFLMSIWEKEKI